ncbi:MAG: acyl--CoA ligase [Oscillospiraceae bacterium]|nr:acyl--CoA ligase [Oscillospiraceae bacterium]
MTEETSIYEYARQGLSLSGNGPALWFYGKQVSYESLFEKIDRVAGNLYDRGVRQGTVVTIHLPNCPQAVMAIYAVAKLGGICNMVHPLTPVAALRENLCFTESQWLITSAPDCLGSAEQEFFVDLSCYMGLPVRTLWRLKHKPQTHSAAVPFGLLERRAASLGEYPEGSLLAEMPAVYLHSSGTTGKPKTILLSHSALNHCAANTADFFENGDMQKQVSLGVLPLFHGFGLAMDVHRNLCFGSQLVQLPKWNARQAVKLIKKYKITLMVGVPAMFYGLLNEPEFRGKGISQLAKCYVGGDTVKPELVKAFDDRIGGGHHMFQGFGLTEATTTNCVNTYRHYKVGSAGYPVRNTVIAVRNADGSLSPAGEGELVISSKSLMMGYLRDPQATKDTLFYAQGRLWTRTGDQALIDEEGFLHFQRRIKNIIIRNGYNIYPEQLEAVIRTVPGVLDVCAVGVEEEALHTQKIRAVVIPSAEAETADLEQHIREICLERLPRYAVPGEIVFMSAFPQNAMGKIDRKELSKP